MMELARFENPYLVICYVSNLDGQIGFCLFPAGTDPQYMGKGHFEPLVQIRLVGDDYASGYCNGQTMRNSETARSLRFVNQSVQMLENGREIITILSGNGMEVCHHAILPDAERTAVCFSTVKNIRDEPVWLEMLSSFTLGGLSPFFADEGSGHLKLHKLLSFWSSEGRPYSITPEALNFERSWAGHGNRVHRFGAIGSLPLQGYFPFAGVEDTQNHVTWAAELCLASSWQMEFARKNVEICLSGGLADGDTGHWKKMLAPQQSFKSPWAIVTAARGGIDAAQHNLCSWVNRHAPFHSPSEKRLPVMFNEYCTTWGNPSLENIKAIVDKVSGHELGYFVIDCGWYRQPDGHWETDLGDWDTSAHMFPDGIDEAAAYIRAHGMTPGIWFEIENIGSSSSLANKTDWLLKRDGRVIRAGTRRMLDLENPEVWDYLRRKVAYFLRDNGFGYIKVDYNENIGVGCDGAESLGESLRRKIARNQDFFRLLEEINPGLLIENCASGGHRLEPSMLLLTDMSSFSDAHEEREIPVIAANVGRLVPARQNQIWAVLRKTDDRRRLEYSLSAGMLGRLCLSGDVHELTDVQWEIIDEAIAFYHKSVNVLLDSELYITQSGLTSWRNLEGWQCALRINGSEALAVIHSFSQPKAIEVEIPGDGTWEIAHRYGQSAQDASYQNGRLLLPALPMFSGCAVLLQKRNARQI